MTPYRETIPTAPAPIKPTLTITQKALIAWKIVRRPISKVALVVGGIGAGTMACFYTGKSSISLLQLQDSDMDAIVAGFLSLMTYITILASVIFMLLLPGKWVIKHIIGYNTAIRQAIKHEQDKLENSQ